MESITTLKDFLYWAEQAFTKAKLYFGHGTNNAWDEACSLACFTLKLPPNVGKAVGKRILTQAEKKALLALALRRIQTRCPLPYLTKEAWFAGLQFYVDERVIIPRSPFAELITKGFQPWLADRTVHRVLDLCTGSACIAIAIALAFEDVQVDAVDISKEALQVATKNIALHNCENRVQLLHADLFNACTDKQYDIIISNPPYVDAYEMQRLPKEFQWEPILALEAGPKGLDIVRRILKETPRYLSERGLLFVEVGASEKALRHMFPKIPFTWLSFERGGEGVFLLTAEEKSCWSLS